MSVYEKTKHIASKAYKVIFKEEMGPGVLDFFVNVFYVAVSYGITALCVFVFEVSIARTLGPKEYGKFILVSSVGLFISFLMSLGVNNALVKYGIEEKEFSKKRAVFSNSYFLSLVLSLGFGFLLLVFVKPASHFFGIFEEIFTLAVFFGFSLTLYNVSIDSFRGMMELKKIPFVRIFYGLFIVACFFIFLSLHQLSFFTAILIISSAYLIIFLMTVWAVRKYISLRSLDCQLSKKILKYGFYTIIGGSFFTLLPLLTQIFINKYKTTTELGIYNAYYVSSINVMLILYNAFIVVFFPTSAKHHDKLFIFKKASKTILFCFVPGVIFIFMTQLAAFYFFGSQYPKDYFLMILFSVASLLVFTYGVYGWLFYSRGIGAAKKVVVSTAVIFLAMIMLCSRLIPLFSFYGAIYSVIITYIFGILYLYVNKRMLL